MDLLNISGEESLDLPDITFGMNDVPTGLVNELTGGFLIGAGQGTIVSGFVPGSAGASGPVVVGQDGVRNVALLGYQTGKGITYGVLSVDGNNAKSYDVSTYAPGTYGIYVRFNRQPAEAQTRVFWSGIDNAEYAKTTYTRLAATWEARIEVAQPAPEWLLIGQVTITSQGSGQGNSVSVADQRPLYFEGSFSNGYAPTWGSDADRSARQTATIGTLRRMIDALKQSIVDIKGPGLQPWYSRFIGGMNIGPRFPTPIVPTSERVAVGDGLFFMQGDQFGPTLAFNGPGNDLLYARNSNIFSIRFNSTAGMQLTGGFCAIGQNIPNLISPNQPLLVCGPGPFGRVAQFWHTGGSDPAAISIGNTLNTGGRIDFAAPSLSDFKSNYWTILARNGVGTPNDFSISSASGLVLMALNNGAGDYTTNLTGSRINLTASGSSNAFVSVNALSVGPQFNAFANGGTPWLTYNYNSASNTFTWDGYARFVSTKYVNGYFLITFTVPFPRNAVIIATSALYNQAATTSICYRASADRTMLYIYITDSANDAQPKPDFNLTVFYGSPDGTTGTAVQ